MSESAPQSGTMLHGPGGLLATPGLGSPRRRKGRKWGMRIKDSGYGARAGQTIRGNLARGGDGKFAAAGNASAAKPKRGVTLSKQPKPGARPARAAAPKKGGAAKRPASPTPKDPAVAARQQQRDQEHTEDRANSAADRAQRQADRQTRIERTQTRDQERAARQADAAKKKLEPKSPKAGGGGSKKLGDDKAQERAKKAVATATQVGMAPTDLAALRSATEAGGVTNAALTTLGLLGADGLATDQGRRALQALERGDVRQYQAALQDAKARMGRESSARERKQQTEGRRTQTRQERARTQQQRIDRLKRRAVAGSKLTQSQMDQLSDAGVLGADGRMKSFTVFKDHTGAHRWIARTTTAYRDRDNEIISEAALDADSQRMTRTKQFGPLRYWHIGQPDPASLDAPWGPGVDIGTCDFSVVIGRTRIESGVFHNAVIARKMAAVADRHEMSPGFLYTPDQPDSDGVFTAIRTFERSPVPRTYARAANLFTGFAVKEHTMELPEMERRFKAMYQELGLTPEQGAELGQQLIATEKAASAQGIAFKDAAPSEDITINGVVYAVKAAAPPFELDVPVAETKADDPMAAIAEEVIEPEAELAGEYLGDMSWDEFAAKLGELLAPVLKMQDMVKSIGDAHTELKTMYGGVAQKDASHAQELAALKTQQEQLVAKITQIEGDQPSVILPDDVAAALKSAGPASTAPEQPEVPDDPSRPYATFAARTMPALYRNGPAGEFAGWTPPPSS